MTPTPQTGEELKLNFSVRDKLKAMRKARKMAKSGIMWDEAAFRLAWMNADIGAEIPYKDKVFKRVK
jgi:hypothetical protein